MFKKVKTYDWVLLSLAFLSLIFAEISWYTGDKDAALFVGMWVPSILGFAIYLKLLKIDSK
jgi:hypothetical protein